MTDRAKPGESALDLLTARPDALAVARAGLEALGIDVAALPPVGALLREGAAVPRPAPRPVAEHVLELYAAAAAHTGDPWLGLRLGLQRDAAWLGPFGAALLASETIGGALALAERFIGLLVETQTISSRVADGECEVVLDFHPGASPEGAPIVLAASLLAVARIFDDMIAPHHLPQVLSLGCARPPRELLSRLRRPGRVLRFDARRWTMRIPAAALALSPRGARGTARAELVAQLQRAAAELELRSDVERRVRRRLLLELAEAPSVSRVARELGMSTRALQLALAARGTSYSALLAEVRLEVAERLLRRSRMPIARISQLVGFRSAAAFTRFYRSATGKPPRTVR